MRSQDSSTLPAPINPQAPFRNLWGRDPSSTGDRGLSFRWGRGMGNLTEATSWDFESWARLPACV